MIKTPRILIALVALATAAACKNPADGKQRAQVAEAKPEGAAPRPTVETLPITPERSKIEWVGSKVTGSHKGRFGKFTGSISLAGDDLTKGSVSIQIDMDSVTSDSEKLTGHLKSPDFFDVAKFPTATFTSTAIAPSTEGKGTHVVTGNLELHGVKRSISFPATLALSPAGLTATSEFVLNRKDFGIVYPGMPDDLIRDEVVLTLSIDAPRSRSSAK